MNMRSIDYFLAVAKAGSINKAASALYISQPALSQYLARIEAQLGVKLLIRGKNSAIRFTPAGLCYKEYCERSVELWNRAQHDIAAIIRQEQSHLTIGSSAAFLQELLQKTDIAAFLSAEKIQVIIDTAAGLLEKLRSHEIDMILSPIDTNYTDFNCIPFQTLRLDLYVSSRHPLACHSYRLPGNENKAISLSDTAPYPFVLLDETSVLRSVVERYFYIMNFRPVAIYYEKHPINVHLKLLISESVGFLVPAPTGNDGVLMPIMLNSPVYCTRGAISRKGEKLPVPLQELIRRCREGLSAPAEEGGRQ